MPAACNNACNSSAITLLVRGPRTGLAVTESGAVVGADAGKLRDLRLHLAPGNVCVAETRFENDRGASLPRTVDVHLETAHVEATSRHGIKAAVACLRDVLVDNAGKPRITTNTSRPDDDAAKPRMRRRGGGRRYAWSEGMTRRMRRHGGILHDWRHCDAHNCEIELILAGPQQPWRAGIVSASRPAR